MNIIETNLGFGSMSYRSKTTRIILHHAAAVTCSVQDVHRWHINNGWAGIGYHFFVRKDGSVYRGRPENAVGAHASGSNSDSIGICFEGNFDIESMPAAQIQAGKELVSYLKGKYGIGTVQRHRDVGATSCPGNNFPFSEIAGVAAGGSATSVSGSSGTLRVDGWWGGKTTTRAQQVYGTQIDGIVSNQPAAYRYQNPGIDSSFEWQENPTGYSPLIKAIQIWAGMPESEQDGRIGPKTISAIQRKLGCAVDGCFSGPSPCIKAFQTWLNQQAV